MADIVKKPASTDPESVFMRPRDVAAYLSISLSTVRNLIRTGKLPSVRITPDTIGVFRKDVKKFVSELKVTGGEA